MARPLKDGVDYFPKDTSFYNDDKVRLLRGEFGVMGMYVLDYLLCEIYGKNGYFLPWDSNKPILIAEAAGAKLTHNDISEVVSGCTVIYKMYRKDSTVHFSVATRLCEIVNDVDTGLSLYPIAHFNWEEKEGSARGEGEVRYLIPNQIEVNRTEMRRVLTVKSQAYPHKVIDAARVENPDAIDTVGGIIRTNNSTVDDVHKVVGTLPPAQMSPDVRQLQEDLINITRDLAGAGDAVTGQVDPERAAGRAILAVQQAAEAPMTEQKESFMNFIEDLAKIWLEYLIVHSADGLRMEEKVIDPKTNEETIVLVPVSQAALKELQASVKIDVTPKGVFDKFAQEQTIENLMMQNLFTSQRVGELEIYADLLDNDSVAPKMKILEAVKKIKKRQQRIAQIAADAQLVQQKANDFLMGDIDDQAQQIADARDQLMSAQGATDIAAQAENDVELNQGDYAAL